MHQWRLFSADWLWRGARVVIWFAAPFLMSEVRRLTPALPTLLQIGEHLLGDFLQGLKHSGALEGYGFDQRLVFPAKLFGQGVHGEDIWQIAFVELQHVGNLVEVVAVFLEVGHEVVEGFDIRVHALLLRVGHENDAVYAAQDQFAAGVVENLAGNGVQVNARLEAADGTQVERQKIKKQSSFRLRGQRDHLALLLLGGLLVDELKIRRLAAQPGAVVNDLAVDLAGCEVDETQDFPRNRWRRPPGHEPLPG